MKRLLFFLLLLFSLNAANAQAGLNPFGWVDVRQFGAIGDSSTDNTTAVRNALASLSINGRGGVLYFPPGRWVINDSCIVPANVTIMGAGGNIFNDSVTTYTPSPVVYMSATAIITRSATHSIFVTGNPIFNTGKSGINIEKISFFNQAGSTPSNGSALVFRDGGDEVVTQCSFDGFYTSVNVINAIFYSFNKDYFNNCVLYHMNLGNTNSSDQGDYLISDCKFTSGKNYTHPTAHIYWHGTGGFKLADCKMVFSSLDTSKTMYYGIYFNNVDASPSDIMITNTSIEGIDSFAIKMIFPAAFRHITINNIQTETYYQAVCPAIQIKFASAGANNGIATIDNINSYSYPSASAFAAVSVTNADQLLIGKIVAPNYATPYNLVNCTNTFTYLPIPYNLINTAITTIQSAGPLAFIADHGVSTNGPDVITFSQGDNTERVRIDYQGRLLSGTGTPFSNGAGRFIQGEFRKDTATQVALALTNASASASASLAIEMNAGSASGFIEMLNQSYAGYKNIGANSLSLYNAVGGINLLADGSTVTLGNTNGAVLTIAAAGYSVGLNGNSPLAQLDIGQPGNTFQLNGSAGSVFSLRTVTMTDNVTAASGTVTNYAVAGFGIATLGASNASVTYTNAATIYVAGPPTASTNITITNDWAVKIASGATLFGAATTTSPSFNIPSGTAPTSPNNGDVWSDGTHAKIRLGGTSYQLDFPAQGTAGHIPVSDGTNWVASTPTFPNASATLNKVIKSDGTNWVASTETYAVPGTSGNIFTSDGTNWTSAANTGGWTTLHVSGSDVTTTGQTLVDITGLVTGTLTASTLYEYEAILYVTGTDANGNEYAVQGGGTGTTATVFAIATGTLAASTTSSVTINAPNTATTAMVTGAFSGVVIIKGFIVTRSTGTPTLSIQHLKVTSGTSTVKIGSVLRYRLAQ